jgi:hypothetical protein
MESTALHVFENLSVIIPTLRHRDVFYVEAALSPFNKLWKFRIAIILR